MIHLLDTIRIILVAPSHPGNIGATARAMKNMGLSQLTLVTPRHFPCPEATALAAGAVDILANVQVVASLFDAIKDCHYVLGCTPRARKVSMPELAPREAAEIIRYKASNTQKVAIVFGTERSGLTNDEIQQCHAAVNIPANPFYDSLNLAQAVQVICYEIRMAVINDQHRDILPCEEKVGQQQLVASMNLIDGFFTQAYDVLQAVDFFKGRPSFTIMRRLRRLFMRVQLSEAEITILRGILTDVQRTVKLGSTASSQTRSLGMPPSCEKNQ